MNRFEPELIAVMKDVLEQVAKRDSSRSINSSADGRADSPNSRERQANEILRKASAYFAMAELDGRSKTAAATLVWSARAVVAEGETTTV
jgi:hypothetical protein